MSGAFNLSELNTLIHDLSGASTEVKKKAAVAVRKTAFDIEAESKLFAPVDTGNLRNSISTTITSDGQSAEIGPTAEYGVYVELGTSVMAPAAFMGPAFDRKIPDFEDAIAKLASEDMF